MSADTANLSAFAAYNITPTKSGKQNKNKPGKGKAKGNDTFIDEFLNDQRKKFKSTNGKNGKRSRSPNKSKQNLANGSKTELKGGKGTKKEATKKQGDKKTKATQKATKENLNFTEDFVSSTSNAITTSTPSLNGSVNGTKKTKKAKRQNVQKRAQEPAPIFEEEEQRPAKIAKIIPSISPISPSTPKSRSTINKSLQSPLHQKLLEEGSIALAKHRLKWVINPVSFDDFKEMYWEKAPVCVSRNAPKYYSQLLSTKVIDQVLRENVIEFTKNIDITSYENGVRETHNPEGRALPPAVWDFYRDGCSIRFLNPQTFIPQIHELNATLQEYFHCMTGANVYLTPPNSQGFAPHYDDIEAFVLQIEGKKLWKLYAPRTENEFLPRVSSGNFKPDEIGQPILEKTLEAGDLMYFPRGTIHQAQTVPGHHSLHITLSVYQKTSFGDLFEILVPQALEKAINSDIELRRGLPFNLWNNMGLVYADEGGPARAHIISTLKRLFSKVLQHADFDRAVDQMAIKYQNDALPPAIVPSEAELTVYGKEVEVSPAGEVQEVQFLPDTMLRLLRANILRMVAHEDVFRIHYHTDNSKEYHEYDPNFIEVDGEMAPAIEYLIKAYPTYIPVDDLPVGIEQALEIVFQLWNRGLIMTQKPLE